MLAVGIKTFMREESLLRLLDSIDQFLPKAKIYIADDSEIGKEKAERYQLLESLGHVVLKLPFDIGLSAGRNALMEAVSEEYVLYCDDDYLITKESDVDQVLSVLKSRPDIDMITGTVVCGIATGFEDFCGDWETVNGVRIRPTRKGLNFFLARTATFKQNKWNPKYKINKEHEDFFKRFQGKVYFCPTLRVEHENRIPAGQYAKYRNRND